MAIASMAAVVEALRARLAHWGPPVTGGTDIDPTWTWADDGQEVKVFEVSLMVTYFGPGAQGTVCGDRYTDPGRVLRLLADAGTAERAVA